MLASTTLRQFPECLPVQTIECIIGPHCECHNADIIMMADFTSVLHWNWKCLIQVALHCDKVLPEQYGTATFYSLQNMAMTRLLLCTTTITFNHYIVMEFHYITIIFPLQYPCITNALPFHINITHQKTLPALSVLTMLPTLCNLPFWSGRTERARKIGNLKACMAEQSAQNHRIHQIRQLYQKSSDLTYLPGSL